jgi:Ca2+-binding RTX toxin-like protein
VDVTISDNDVEFYGSDDADRIGITGTGDIIAGLGGDDEITAAIDSVAVYASGNYNGGAGDDAITATVTGAASVSMFLKGGIGDDTLIFRDLSTGAANDYFYSDAGSGDDSIRIETTSTDPESWSYAEVIGQAGDDVIFARFMGAGETLLIGESGDDRITSKVYGDGYSQLFGGEGNDRLAARGGTDNLLVGNQGEDRLYGSSGEDRMIGGIGDDFLRGRGGADEFVFMGLREADRDRIFDFHIGEDKVDLSAVDANKFMSGNQAFQFSDGWHGTGRVWAEDVGKTTTLLHVDNGRVEMTIALLDGADVHADDYGASDFLL